MTRPDEPEIEMVQRHVREGAEHVARQRELVNRLPPSSEIAGIARALLANFEEVQEAHRDHLARLLGSEPSP